MRKIFLLEFLSLDNVMQAPGGSKEDTAEGFKFGGWTAPFENEESNKMMLEQMKMPFELLLGRKTYDIFAGFWPEHEDQWPGVNGTRKYVVSSQNIKPEWNNTSLITGDVVEELKKLKNEDGANLYVYGSGKLAQTLLKNDLVDEMWLKTYPVVLGTGKKLFAEGTIPASFKLTKSHVTSKGVIFANYVRDGEVKTGEVG